MQRLGFIQFPLCHRLLYKKSKHCDLLGVLTFVYQFWVVYKFVTLEPWFSTMAIHKNHPDCLKLLRSGCHFLETDLLVLHDTGHQHFLEAPQVFLTGEQGFKPLPEGLESLPCTTSALPRRAVLLGFISTTSWWRMAGSGAYMDRHWIIPSRKTC